MDNMFQEQKNDPPLNKCQPPVAGAIAWERSLFHRIKHTIIRFQTEEDMMNSEMGKQVITTVPFVQVIRPCLGCTKFLCHSKHSDSEKSNTEVI